MNPPESQDRQTGVKGGGTLALGSAIGSGVLPSWATYATVLGSAALVAALLMLTGSFAVGFLFVGTVIVACMTTYGWARSVEGPRRAKDRLITLSIASSFALALIPLVSVIVTVVSKGLNRFDVEFFMESARGVVGAGGGASHAILGTILITGVSTVIAVPIGIMAAIYLNEYGGNRRLARSLTFFVDVMTGIPSIVAGLFAYALFVIFFGPGVRLGVMGSVALTVLMIPIVIRSSEEILKIVPNHLREASYALGTPKWKTITKVVLPTALAGLVTGVMLAVARIMGETAPLLVTTGVVDSLNSNPFDGRMQNLAVYAYNEYKSPGVPPEPSIDRAWTAAMTLILMVMILNLGARFVYRRYGTEIR